MRTRRRQRELILNPWPGVFGGLLLAVSAPEAPWWHFGVAGIMSGIAWDIAKGLTKE